MAEQQLDLCGCCHQQKPIVGVACIPGVPMSIAWCSDCLQADVIPYEIAVANTACCGGWSHCNPEWRQLVRTTLVYFNKSCSTFLADVQAELHQLDKDNSA